MTELLVGTKKGLFILRGDAARPGRSRSHTARSRATSSSSPMRDPRSGRYFASVTSGFYGPRVMFADDPAGTWEQATGLVFPDGSEDTLARIWVIKTGEADGLLYAGADPAALFTSTDGGASWSLNEALWKERHTGDWQPGLGGLALHSICPWPGEPDRLAVGVSAAGVWRTEDGGNSWQSGFEGMVPEYLPEDARDGTNILCVHNMHRAPGRPQRLFMQFHGSVYRSDDEGAHWIDIAAGLPSGFGFPLVVDPGDPDRAYVIPLVSPDDRVTPGQRVRVYATADAGASWTGLGEGLPQHDAYLTILRQAFDREGAGEDLGLYFGATSGEVFGSADGGSTWSTVQGRLAPVTSVRVA